jgi:hypothetical protein
MDDGQRRFDGEEDESSHDPFWDKAQRTDDSEETSEATAALAAGCSNHSNYDELIEEERPKLFEIAYAKIRNTCSDPQTHKEDVAHEGIKKFLRAVRNPGTHYPEPEKVLRAAVWQEGMRHSETCPREQAVDFNNLSDKREDPNAPSPTYSLGDFAKRSVNPTEIYNGILEIAEKVKKVTDKDLFIMYFVEQRSIPEIAEIRGADLSKMYRALKRLKKELGMSDEERPPTPGPTR